MVIIAGLYRSGGRGPEEIYYFLGDVPVRSGSALIWMDSDEQTLKFC